MKKPVSKTAPTVPREKIQAMLDLLGINEDQLREALTPEQAPNTTAEPAKQAPVTLTRREAAAFLHVHPVSVDRYRRQGLLTSHKIGQRVLYYQHELETALHASTPLESISQSAC